MAETTEKKAKAPAKRAAKPKAEATTSTPKKAAAKKTTKPVAESKATHVAEKVTRVTPTHEEIARLAEKYWAERGHTDGHAEQDWLRAEQELMKKAS